MFETVGRLQKQNRLLEKQVESSSKSFDVRITDIEDEVGPKPKYLAQEFDAPSLWSAVGNLT